MNKKIIKYAILTILIVVALILIPANKTRAAIVTFREFKTSPHYFCLNRGYPFGDVETFAESRLNGEVISFPGTYLEEDRDVLEYIISEANQNYIYRDSISNYTPQEAIWGLTGRL